MKVTPEFCLARIDQLEKLLARVREDESHREIVTRRIAMWWGHYKRVGGKL
ncbi:hypothetical protein [Saccharopolyspora taberi]|uniref:Uncharacterized protein n=1 Tax=Saccharopolyspora taberi TaxID=60895 RepID=A0ABN3V0L7_9PSEU